MFGESHVVTKISEDFNGMARKIVQSGGPEEPGDNEIAFVDRFDPEEMGYIG